MACAHAASHARPARSRKVQTTSSVPIAGLSAPGTDIHCCTTTEHLCEGQLIALTVFRVQHSVAKTRIWLALPSCAWAVSRTACASGVTNIQQMVVATARSSRFSHCFPTTCAATAPQGTFLLRETCHASCATLLRTEGTGMLASCSTPGTRNCHGQTTRATASVVLASSARCTVFAQPV
jgi:hypothetical protein